MEKANCSYEVWNYKEKINSFDNNTQSEIYHKILGILNNFKNIKTIYTHNEFGEYGHIDPSYGYLAYQNSCYIKYLSDPLR